MRGDDDDGKLKTAHTTRRHELGIESLVFYPARNTGSFLPRLWHLQRSWGGDPFSDDSDSDC